MNKIVIYNFSYGCDLAYWKDNMVVGSVRESVLSEKYIELNYIDELTHTLIAYWEWEHWKA